MSSGWNLQQMESFFQHWDEKISNPSLRTILELYNIKKFIDLGSWWRECWACLHRQDTS